MTGATADWYELASRLHAPVQYVKRSTTATEFSTWKEFLRRQQEEEITRRDKWELYAATIAAEVRRSYVKKGVKVSVSDFLIDFKELFERAKQKAKEPSRTKEEATERMKAAIYGWLRRKRPNVQP